MVRGSNPAVLLHRRRRRVARWVLLASAVVAACGAYAVAPARAEPGKKAEPHLDYRRTYAEALMEARVRNVPVFVSRHKDE